MKNLFKPLIRAKTSDPSRMAGLATRCVLPFEDISSAAKKVQIQWKAPESDELKLNVGCP